MSDPPDSNVTPVGEWAQLRARSAQLTTQLIEYAFDCRMKAARPGVQPLARIGLRRNATLAEDLAAKIERYAKRSETWADKSESGRRGEQAAVRHKWLACVREAESLMRGWEP